MTVLHEMNNDINIFPGEYAWLALALGIIGYDTVAVVSKKAETMSSALWRSLSHPIKFPLAAGAWFGLTWHLFANPRARNSYRAYGPKIQKIKTRKVL